MTIQTFVAGQTLTASQMNTLQASDFNSTRNVQSGSTYSLVAGDVGKLIEFTNNGAVTFTIPTNATVPFNVGDRVDVLLASTGSVTIVPAAGVTVNAEGGLLTISSQWSKFTLIKRETDSWVITGAGMQVQTIEIEDGAVTSAKIADGTIVNADINASAAIAHSKLANATAGQVLLGTTTTGIVTATTVSGDVTITGAGVTAIGSGVIVNADINASAAIDKTKISGTAITAADTGTVTSTMIADGTIVNADISATAAIDLGKLADATILTKTSNHTLALTDKNKFIEMNITSTANTVSVPTDASVDFPVGSQINITQYGTGKTQIVAVTPGTTSIRATPGTYLRDRYSSATLIKRAANEWYLIGDLSAS